MGLLSPQSLDGIGRSAASYENISQIRPQTLSKFVALGETR